MSLFAITAVGQTLAPTPGAQKSVDRTAAPPQQVSESEHGWFFYDDPEEETPRPLPPPPPPPTGGSGEAKPAVGSVAWIAANIDQIRDRAIDNPTQANVELFGYVQKLAMDKSEVFATRFVQAMAANPALDETGTHPVSGYANLSVNRSMDAGRSAALRKLAQTTAIWYFFKSDCPYCHRQSPLLEQVGEKYGFGVLPISLDNLPLQDGSYPDWIADEGQGRALGVTATPTLYLVHPPNDVVFLSTGLRALPEIEDRIMSVARSKHWLSEEEYQKAMVGLPQKYLTTSFDPTAIKDPNDSAQVLAALRAAGMHNVQEEDLRTINQATTTDQASPWDGKE